MPGEPFTQRFKDIANSAQSRLNEIVVKICKYALSSNNTSNLCLSGGVALNCQTNLIVSEKTNLHNIYIPSAPNDSGVALGAAILESEKQGYKTEKLTHSYLGNKYKNEEIKKLLNNHSLKFKEYDDPVQEARNDILNGKIIGWFSGKMEFGPRALGSRSILADPRQTKMKQTINNKIKFREEFRPFCPSVLTKNISKFYDEKFFSPFMNINKRAKKITKKNYPAIVHVDGTSRVQSVSKVKGHNYYDLMIELEKKDNLQNLLNTSLNINGQTLVNKPSEAIKTFYCSGLDSLYIENFKVIK